MHAGELHYLGGVALGRVDDGVAELLHVSHGVPDLDNRRCDAVAEQRYDDADALDDHRAARGNVVGLPQHLEEVAEWVGRGFREDDDVPFGLMGGAPIAYEGEVDRRRPLLTGDAYDAAASGEELADFIHYGEETCS